VQQEKVVIRWDGSSQPARWNVDILQEDLEGRKMLVLNSAHPNFPINVREFGPLDEDALINSIKTSFPGAHINMEF